MMEFDTLATCSKLDGKLVYRESEYSLDFEPDQGFISHDIAGQQGTTSIMIDTLQIEVALETRRLLYVWGYFPAVRWERATVLPISAAQGCVRIRTGAQLIIGVTLALGAAEDWRREYDATSGWLSIHCATPTEHDRAVEFATGCVAVLREERLIALWLHPLFE